MEPCHCQPIDVPNDASIARGLFYSFHLKRNGTLKWQAFKPDIGDSDISVMRLPCLSASACKSIAKQMQANQKEYRGFALFDVETLRAAGFEVSDSREIFCGHADLSLGVANTPVVEAEPLPNVEGVRLLEDVCRQLKELACARIDPSPDLDEWPIEKSWLPTD